MLLKRSQALMMAQWTCIYVVMVVIYGGYMLSDALPPVVNNPSAAIEPVKKVLGKAEIDQLSDYISKYLFYFERLRQTGVNDHIKQAMHVVKLLIVQTWLSTLEPETGFFTIPRRKSLQDIKNSITSSIKEIEKNSPHKVKDFVIYYMKKIEPHITNELESEKNSLKYMQKVFYDDEKVLAEQHDEKTIILFKNTWDGILDVLSEIRSNIIVHKISSRMVLQGYISNFIPGQDKLGDKFTITSSDGSEREEFDTPKVGRGIFADLVEIASELDKDISANDKIKYEVYYHILNERIRKYLDNFEKRIEKYMREDEELGKAMKTVKSLTMQGWIEAMMPGPEFYPIKKSETLESIKNEIVQELQSVNRYFRVSDAILLYTDEKEPEIEKEFKNRKDTLEMEYKRKMEILKSKKETPENKEEINEIKKELKELERKINIENDNLVGHKVCKLFYLNSYREDFIPEQQRNINFKIEASKFYNGRVRARDFNVPSPIEVKDFFSDFIKMDLE